MPLLQSVSQSAIYKNLENCIMQPDYDTLEPNTQYSISIIADEGYTFLQEPNLLHRGRYIQPTKIDNTKYIFDFDTDDSYSDYTFTAYATKDDTVQARYGVLQLYKVSSQELYALQQETFINTELQQIVNLSRYFSSIKYLFVDTNNTYREHISIEKVVCDTTAEKCLDDFENYDLGTVYLQGLYNNELDKRYSEIKISLSYLGIMNIPSYFMNETIHITARVHFISGYCTIFAYCVKDNKDYLITTLNAKIGFDMPYVDTLSNDYRNTALKSDDYTQLTPPNIIISEKLKSDTPIYQTSKLDYIRNETGFFQVDYVNINNTHISHQHKAEIESLLKQGVYI